MKRTQSKDWILLIHQLPPKPSNLRVRTWRKLQKLGAVAIKNSVYVLPFNERTYEDFRWLEQEIQSAGGEAAVFQADAVEGATQQEIIAAFHKTRDEEYAAVAAELDQVTEAIGELKPGGRLSGRRMTRLEADLDRLHKELERIVAIDFFVAPGRRDAVTAMERCQDAFRSKQNRKDRLAKARTTTGSALDPAKYQGRQWVTRRNLFIDRLASIWLIKRFIDRRPRFRFVSDGESAKGAVPFDMYGAEFTHQGEDCTFETLIKRFGFGQDAGLREISEIVHDIDLKDGKFNRVEATGLSAVIGGLADLLRDDRKLVRQCTPIFDGLYESFNRDTDRGMKARQRAGQREKRTGRGRQRPRRT